MTDNGGFVIIGIVGTIAGGKDTVAEYLVSKGFEHVSLSDTLREIMQENQIETTIPNMIDFGNKLRSKKGNDILARLAFNKLKGKNAVLTSIRQTGEIEFLNKQSEFVLIKVDAPIGQRFKRLISRHRDGDIKTLEELKEIEKKQAKSSGSGQNMDDCFKLCQFEIINNESLEGLYKKVNDLLNKFKSKNG